MSFCGEFEHSLDEKHRLVTPSKFRTFIKEEDREGFYLLASPAKDEKCLRLYTPTAWRKQVEVLRKQADQVENPAEYIRLFASQAEFVHCDSQMRFVLPQRRMQEVGLKRDILLIGTFDWIEVWDPREYEDSKNRLREKYANNLTKSPTIPGENR